MGKVELKLKPKDESTDYSKNLESKLKNIHQASNLNKIIQNYAAPPNRRYKVVSLQQGT